VIAGLLVIWLGVSFLPVLTAPAPVGVQELVASLRLPDVE